MIALAVLLAAAQPATVVQRDSLPGAPVTIQFDGIPTCTLVTMLMRDVMRVPYVIAPDVLADRRPTSVNLIMPRAEIPERVVMYLRRSGYLVTLQGGTVYVSRRAIAPARPWSSASELSGQFLGEDPFRPSGSPVAANVVGRSDIAPAHPLGLSQSINSGGKPPIGDAGIENDRSIIDPVDQSPPVVLAYIPAHRDPSYLSAVLTAIFPNLKFGARAQLQAEPSRQVIQGQDGPDVLVITGPADDVERARSLVVVLDRPRPLVAVKAVVLQVSDIQARGSALSVLAALVNGHLGVGSFGQSGDAAAPGQFVRIAAGAVQVVLSAVREDARFRVVASPNLTALSGASASINSGEQVPTIGATVAGDNGPPVQSVVYRDSGIILTVRPVVRGELVELQVHQERSNFVRTATGVTNTPTLQRASADASVVMKSGESLALAGLTETSNSNTHQGIVGGLLGIRRRDTSQSELVVLLTAEIVPSPVSAPGVFVPIPDPSTSKEGETDDRATDPLAPTPRRAGAATAARGQ